MTELRPAQGESESAWTKKGQRTGVDMIAAVRRTGEEWHNKQRRSAGKEKTASTPKGYGPEEARLKLLNPKTVLVW